MRDKLYGAKYHIGVGMAAAVAMTAIAVNGNETKYGPEPATEYLANNLNIPADSIRQNFEITSTGNRIFTFIDYSKPERDSLETKLNFPTYEVKISGDGTVHPISAIFKVMNYLKQMDSFSQKINPNYEKKPKIYRDGIIIPEKITRGSSGNRFFQGSLKLDDSTYLPLDLIVPAEGDTAYMLLL